MHGDGFVRVDQFFQCGMAKDLNFDIFPQWPVHHQSLLPIPPFDGSHIAEGLLPAPLAAAYSRMRRFGFTLVLVLIIVLPSLIPGFDLVGKVVRPPVDWVSGHYLGLAKAIAGVPPGE